MDFFATQDRARRSTSLLVAYFSLAVVLTILLVYLIPVLGLHAWKVAPSISHEPIPMVWWYPDLFIWVCGATLVVVLGGAAFKISELRRGGGRGVAQMLGGREILPETSDFFERRLRNVVEEMAIAAGVPVPPVYVMPNERGINAFAAGFTPSDAVVAVTHGTMTGLTREELQGVIAHEFSHILNKDMMLNINLMGFLHGLIIIGLTGKVILENFAFRGRGSRDSMQIILFLMAAAISLIIVGFTGYFFCNLIKASISRHRERLADASAVQFTRNPGGLASALKKIGGLADGSRIRASKAEQASHMFFGNALRGGLFNTHPSLKERVKWLEPTFDGNFPVVTYDSLRAQLERFEGAPKIEQKENQRGLADLFADPLTVAAAATVMNAPHKPKGRPASPHQILESIGRPMAHHADRARELIDSIPVAVRAYTESPYGARMLVYFLLLDQSEPIQEKQMAAIKQMAEPGVVEILHKALASSLAIPPELRLPIIDLSIPALRLLSENQYRNFTAIVDALVNADGDIDVFEYALQRVLSHHLDPIFEGRARRPAANFYSIRGLVNETAVVLSMLARKGHGLGDDAATAFHAATDVIDEPDIHFDMLDPVQCTWDVLDAALDKIGEASAQVKKLILSAMLTCMMHDRELTVGEVELFRAIAITLDCPVPPWVTPVGLD